VTTVVLTHGHPIICGAFSTLATTRSIRRASYVVSAREWDLWADPSVLQRLPAALPKERIVGGARATSRASGTR
jgi:hypothetical protein